MILLIHTFSLERRNPMEIKFIKTTNPGVMPPENQLGFGKVFSDHMFIMDYDEEQGWHDHRIVPFGSISLHPASTVLHYGAEVFEGLKAYRTESGSIRLFRPMDNIKRLNTSAERLCLPLVNEDEMLEILKIFVKPRQNGFLARLARRSTFAPLCSETMKPSAFIRSSVQRLSSSHLPVEAIIKRASTL